MTLQSILPTFLYYPMPMVDGGALSSALGNPTLTFDSVTDRIAWVGNFPITDTITTVSFRTGTVTVGSTIEIRIETVTNGRPSGTLWAANTNGTVVVANGDDSVWKTVTLTSAANITAGDEIAIVVVNSSGTPNMQFSVCSDVLGKESRNAHYPLLLLDAGAGTWAGTGISSSTGQLEWIVTTGTAGVIYLPNLSPLDGAGTVTTFNSGASPDERALRFQVPFKCRVIGLHVGMANNAAGSDFTFSLWNTSGTTDAAALAQATCDGDFALSTTQDGYVDLFFATPVTLDINTTYYAGLRADTANNIALYEFITATVTNAIKAFGVNAETYLATRAWAAGTAGAWTTTTTTLPCISLIIDQLDDGVSAGGGGVRSGPKVVLAAGG